MHLPSGNLGSRPSYVVFRTSANHLIGDDTRGEFMSRYMDVTDIASLGARQHYDPTTISSQMFPHASEWFANRAEIRNVLLGTAMPDVQTLTTVLAWRSAHPVDQEELRRKAEPRMRELKELCDKYGARLIIVVPPSIDQDHADLLVSFGQGFGVPVLVPEPVGAMDRSLFRDGFHLTLKVPRFLLRSLSLNSPGSNPGTIPQFVPDGNMAGRLGGQNREICSADDIAEGRYRPRKA